MRRWDESWVDTGICRLGPGGVVEQTLFPATPPRQITPPAMLPPALQTAWTGSLEEGAVGATCSGWGFAILEGTVDGDTDPAATLAEEGSGSSGTILPDGEAELRALAEAVDRLLQRGGTGAVLLRTPLHPFGPEMAAVWAADSTQGTVHATLLSRWDRLLATRGHVWLRQSTARRGGSAWAERAMALALRASLAGDQAALRLFDDTDQHALGCPICMEAFAGALPLPDTSSRAAPGGFLCTHAVCRACDAELRRREDVCPMCRAALRQYYPP